MGTFVGFWFFMHWLLFSCDLHKKGGKRDVVATEYDTVAQLDTLPMTHSYTSTRAILTRDRHSGALHVTRRTLTRRDLFDVIHSS